MLPTKTWSRPEKEKKKRRTISRGLAPFACHSKSTDDILCRQALNFRTLDVPAHLEVTSDTGWKLFTMAFRRKNIIVFGCEVESFGGKRVLCGECYWCCNSQNSMEVFFFCSIIVIFTMDFETLHDEYEIWAGSWGIKETVDHLLLGRSKRYLWRNVVYLGNHKNLMNL